VFAIYRFSTVHKKKNKSKIKGTVLFLLGMCYSLLLIAQPQAKFTSNIVSGCNPIVVSFTDQSTSNPTSWFWDFGNGNTSTLQNPQASYTSPGTYTVSLTATNASGSNTETKTAYITVFKNPVADLSASSATSGCLPLQVAFVDQSQIGDGAITSWTWDFGDGGVSAASNPTYTFTNAGTYSVSLHVVDVNGCSGTKVLNDYIKVFPKPKPAFSASKRDFCQVPAQVFFTNSSTGNGSLTYLWDFGDGDTSTAQNASNTYLSMGSFDVKLVVTDQNGCKDSLIRKKYININNIVADFNPDKDTVCAGSFVSMNESSFGAETYFWDFGDGNTTSVQNPKYVYFSPGIYTVSLKIENSDGCRDSIQKNILVETVQASFSAAPTETCNLPFKVNFTNLSSSNSTQWTFYFGDGSSSNSQNPTHYYHSAGTFKPSLVVYSASGCRDSIGFSKKIRIEPPIANFSMDTSRGCAPLTVDFTDLSTSIENIKSWKWYFGDGDSSDLQNPTHTFYDDTTYRATLYIENDSGCTSHTYKIIEVGITPQVDFMISPDTSCAYDSVQYLDLSTNPSGKPNDEWIWTFGDGTSGSRQLEYHQHVDTGFMKTMLVVGQKGCYDTLIVDSTNYVLAPVSLIFPQFSCDSPFNYLFSQIPKGVHYWEIDFGDGVKKDHLTIDSIRHTYAALGQYKVKTKAYNDSTGCTWPNEIDIIISPVNASFNVTDSTPCVGDSVLFTPVSAFNALTAWDMGDGTQFINYDPKHAYNKSGIYKVKVVASDFNDCKDSVTRFIKVYGITAAYRADSFVCAPGIIHFSDESVSDTTISSWYWHFGTGSYSTKQHPDYTYWQAGTYSPSLVVTNAAGCTDTLIKTSSVIASKPKAGFYTKDNSLCLNDSVKFTDNTSGKITDFSWDFGDGNTSSDKEPSHLYASAGQYTIRLVVTDTGGCKDTAIIGNYIDVQELPIANFYADTIFSVCYPLLVKFSDSSVATDIIYWEWDFGDSTAKSFLQNPAHNYQLPGIYDVKLNIITNFACVDTITKTKYVVVKGPVADFVVDPDTVCYYDKINFKITDKKNVHRFTWDFGDGFVNTNNDDSTSHIYYRGGFYFPQLIYEDSLGSCRKSAGNQVYVSEVIADFSASDSSGEVPLLVDFSDLSSANTVSWTWNFGEGSDTNSQDVSHYYKKAGEYVVSLISKDEFGCLDTALRIIIVEPLQAIVDIPTAFTPNGDGNNDVIKIQGYGTRFEELLSFQVFNRFGELIFETTDPEMGWDGYYKGKLQNMETYVYVIVVKTFEGDQITQKGYISLLH
jgi:gliding motility-associated-like protein